MIVDDEQLQKAKRRDVEHEPIESSPPTPRRVHRLWTFGPQVGGYTWVAEVEFEDAQQSALGVVAPSCFDVVVRHDGEFPTSEPTTTLHGCRALQTVRFGLDIYEAQAAHERRLVDGTDTPVPVSLADDIEELSALRDRLDALLARAKADSAS